MALLADLIARLVIGSVQIAVWFGLLVCFQLPLYVIEFIHQLIKFLNTELDESLYVDNLLRLFKRSVCIKLLLQELILGF